MRIASSNLTQVIRHSVLVFIVHLDMILEFPETPVHPRTVFVLSLVATLAAGIKSASTVGVHEGFPGVLQTGNARLQFGEPALPPLAHARFCLRYPDECKAVPMAARDGLIAVTEERRASLMAVNAFVNRWISPEDQNSNPLNEAWIIAPTRGDCNDYAVTKRYELLKRGWPSSALLLAEVMLATGEHHLVLVVRARHGDLVLDNLTSTIFLWSATPYRWVKMQSPENPKLWWTIHALSS